MSCSITNNGLEWMLKKFTEHLKQWQTRMVITDFNFSHYELQLTVKELATHRHLSVSLSLVNMGICLLTLFLFQLRFKKKLPTGRWSCWKYTMLSPLCAVIFMPFNCF
jgi:hypothetical protein